MATLTKRTAALGLLVAVMVVASAKPQIAGYDSHGRFGSLHELVTGEPVVESDDKYPASLGLVALPLYLVGLATAPSEPPAARLKHVRATVAHFNHLLVVAFAIWLYSWMQRSLQLRHAQAAAAVVLVVLASMLLPHSRDFYSETLWSCWAIFALDRLIDLRRAERLQRSQAAALVVGSAGITWLNPILSVPWVVVVASVWALDVAKRERRRRAMALALLAAAGSLIGTSLILLENVVERGHPFASGYEHEAFVWDPIRIAMQLFSPGKGILWFAPTLLVVPFAWSTLKRFRALPAALAFSAAMMIVYGSWWAWDGATYWGPRFLLLPSILGAIAASVVAVDGAQTSRVARGAAWLTLAIAAFSTKIGLAVGQRYYGECETVPSWCAMTFIQSPFYVLTKSGDEILQIARHQSTISWGIGLLALAYLVCKRPKRAQPAVGASRD